MEYVHSWKILKGPNVFLLWSKAAHVAGLTGCHFLVAIFHSVPFCLFSYLVECEARFLPSHQNPGTTKAKKPNRDVKAKETPIFQHHRRPRFSDLNFSCEIIQSEQAMGDRTGSCSAAPAGWIVGPARWIDLTELHPVSWERERVRIWIRIYGFTS